MLRPSDTDKLPDLLRPGLSVVFVGTAAGHSSGKRGHYYAGKGNRFWATLKAVGLTLTELRPCEFRQLDRFHIGLTDLAKTCVGNDVQIARHHYNRDRFVAAIAQYRPRAVAFNGKKAASFALCTASNRLAYGRQPDRFAGVAEVFILPSTSGAASKYWEEHHWRVLAECAAGLAGPPHPALIHT